jgi:hypothetical protein
MIYSPKKFSVIPEFATIEDAYAFFGDNCNYKYDVLWCKVAGKVSCIFGSSMAEDYTLIGPIGSKIEQFLDEGGFDDSSDGTATALTSEIRDYIYDKLESWGVADIYYFTDTF